MFTKKNGIFICTQVTLAESASDALLDIMDFRISQLENVYHATAILLGVWAMNATRKQDNADAELVPRVVIAPNALRIAMFI